MVEITLQARENLAEQLQSVRDRIGDLEHILMALKARARQQLDQSEEE